MEGMYTRKAEMLEAAEELCKREPLAPEGYDTYKLKCLHPANKENN